MQEKRPSLTNRKGVILQHDNARPHTSLKTKKKLLELDWDILPHPPYSPDLAPSDFYLFRSLQNFLDGKIFNGTEDIKINLIQYFAQKEQKFFEKGIFNLPKRWEKVVEQNGQYIID